tara:strand:+ start:161 stop:499 length:339 start_codon:yes stop_codon:yes gene_type:complete
MVRFFNILAMICVSVFVLASLYIVVGAFVGFRLARRRAARLKCPNCKRPIGQAAVMVGADLQHEHNAAYIRGLELKENEIVDIHFRNLLPIDCPHCRTTHEFDLDELGIGPV